MATFGYGTIGSGESTLDNHVDGSKFTCPSAGTGDSISVALKYDATSWQGKVKCAVYLASDLSAPIANGQTEERTLTLTSAFVWYVFNFPTSPTFAASTDYCLYAWAEDVANTARMARDDDASVDRWYSNQTYNGWPSLPGSDRTGKFSIYCTYTPSAGVTVKPGSIVPLATQLFLDFMNLAKTRFSPCPILRLT